MTTRGTRRSAWKWLGVTLGLALLALTSWQAAPASADRERRAYIEVQFGPPVQTLRLPDPASGPGVNLPAGYIVNGVGKALGTDNALWVQLESPDGRPLGWLPLAAFISAAGLNLYAYDWYYNWYYNRFPWTPFPFLP